MKDFIKRYWVNALGLSFLFMALLYFLKLAVDNGWFPVELRIALSTLLGIVGLFVGFRLYQRNSTILGQVIAGLGIAVLYATVGFISFTESLNWSHGALLISMVGISFLVSGVAVRYSARILFGIGLLGGLITPFVIQATTTMDMPLFIYVLLLDIAAIYVGISKGWKESVIMAFILSMGLFNTYYWLFDPLSWHRPFFYVSSIFGLFLGGFLLSSWRENKKFDGLELLFGAVNALNFIFWSYWILSEFSLPYVAPLLIVGSIFLVIGFVIYRKTNRTATVAWGSYMLLGLVLLGVAGNDLGLLYSGNLKYAITAAVWLIIIVIVKFIGKKLQDESIVYFSLIGFFFLLVYWYLMAWYVDWLPIFGIKYIPFLNPGALVWAGMALLGFSYSNYIRLGKTEPLGFSQDHISGVVALVSHIVVGGLLTVQITNLWDAYHISFIDLDLSLSLAWFVYALILTLWANYSGHVVFNWAGSLVLVASSLKVIFWDLVGHASTQKIIFLLVLGGVTLLIGYVRKNEKRQLTE